MKIKATHFLSLVLMIGLCFSIQLQAISLVYNIKIRRAFNASAFLGEEKSLWIASVLPILYKRDRHIVRPEQALDICEKRLSGGALFNLRYMPSKAWWLELTTGVEKEHVEARGTANFNVSRAGFDDVVFSAGHNIFPNTHSQAVLYGIVGFPSRRTVTALEAQDTLVGTRFFSAGLGSEFSYAFLQSLKKSFIGIFQNRLIHFFSREWFPILPRGGRIVPGNLTDLLFAVQYRVKTDIFETGYNATFFTNQAVVIGMEKTRSENFVRNSGYVRYSHLFIDFPIIHTPVLIGTGFNIARAKRFDTKIFIGWLNISAVF